jgi:phosphocarrier protein
VQVAGAFTSEIWLECRGARANAKSIMSVLSLAAARGTVLTVSAEGADAAAALDAVVALIERGFES